MRIPHSLCLLQPACTSLVLCEECFRSPTLFTDDSTCKMVSGSNVSDTPLRDSYSGEVANRRSIPSYSEVLVNRRVFGDIREVIIIDQMPGKSPPPSLVAVPRRNSLPGLFPDTSERYICICIDALIES